jgi:Sap-like sulfolipid-1-addressing protein
VSGWLQHEHRRIRHDLAMLAQAAVLALAGSIYPLAALIVIGLLSRPGGRPLALVFLAGAALAVTLVAVIELWVLVTLDITANRSRAPSGWLSILLGLALVVIAVVLIGRRGTTDAAPAPRQIGIVGAFLLGAVMYLPGPMYVAAVKTVADAGSSAALTTVGIVVCVVCVLVLTEGPIVLQWVAPRRSERALAAYGRFISQHGRDALLGAALVVGGYLISRGAYMVWSA